MMTAIAVGLYKIFLMVYFGATATWGAFPDVTGRCIQWEATMQLHGLDAETFSPIMWRESRCQTWAHNDTDPYDGSFGLLQINSIHLDDMRLHPDKWQGVGRCQVKTTGDLLVGWRNICFAAHLVERAGNLEPWAM